MNDQNDELVRQLRAFSKLEPSEAATDRAVKRAERAVQQELVATKHQPSSTPRPRFALPLRLAACLGGLLIPGALVVWVVLSFVGGTVALADAVAKMNACRTVSFDKTVSFSGPAGQNVTTKTSTAILCPHLRRDERPDGTICIHDAKQGKWLILDPKQKKKVHYSTNQPRTQADLYEEILQIDPTKSKQLPVKDINGHRCVGFELKEDHKDSIATNFVSTKTVWVDEKTKLPVRIEHVHTADKPYLNAREVLSNFVFDEPLDESLFSLVPPDGYELETPDEGVSWDAAPSWTVAEPPAETADDE